MDKKKALEVVVLILQRSPMNIAEVEAVNAAVVVLRDDASAAAAAAGRLDRQDDGVVEEFPRK